MQIKSNFEMSKEEQEKYLSIIKEKEGSLDNINNVKFVLNDDGVNVDVYYSIKSPTKFERIRRITGYLVGTMDRWNNAKRAEEHDRVKHDAGEKHVG